MEHIHLIGIGGTGLSAIAKLLQESGYQVSGSDQVIGPLASHLQQMGIPVYSGHQAENIRGADLVVQSSAIGKDNPEVLAAKKAGIPVLKRSDFLGRLMQGKTSIAVAGTHGKTTTTSMITWMLTQLQHDPSFIVGGVIKGLDSNAHAGKGAEFVIEADEYDRMFLGLNPRLAVITYLEHDHPDCFPTMADYTLAFSQFTASIQPGGALLVCGDQEMTAAFKEQVPAGVMGFTYGLNPACDYQAVGLTVRNGTYSFDFAKVNGLENVKLAKDVHLSIPGQHNVQNAAAALAVADRLGLDIPLAARAIATFPGTGRRFDIVGEIDGITLVDDYAHHPTEITATLSAARSQYQDHRIWAVWQPHTYSRTRLLKEQFAASFSQADEVIVTEIYASREKKEEYSSADIARLIGSDKATFAPTLAYATQYLLDHIQSGDVVVVLSAGDADQINRQLLVKLSERTN
jgi:UDP-N-acetylmuramate--alanine ligase